MNPILAELDSKKSSSLRKVVAYSLLVLATVIFAIYVGNIGSSFGRRGAGRTIFLAVSGTARKLEIPRKP